MSKISIEDYVIPEKDLAEKIKLELSKEGEYPVKYGYVNPEIKGSLFVPAKKGKEFNWAYVEQTTESSYHFLLLGNPIEWIRLHQRGSQLGPYYSHNAIVEARFETVKLTNPENNDESAQNNWLLAYYPFAEMLTPMNNGTYPEDMREISYRLSGQGIKETVFFTNRHYIGNQIPHPLRHLNSSQVDDFLKTLVADLEIATPTCAKFVRSKFPCL